MKAERRAALLVAATALRSRVQPVEVALAVSQGPNLVEVVACLRWPGVLRVRQRHTGRLIALAQPGQPLVLDAAGTRDEQLHDGRPRTDYFALPERIAALQAGAARLQDRERLPRVVLSDVMWGHRVRAEAVWRWPGIVELYACDTRDLVARSVPGAPGELDESAF
ncbi:MAG: hypothetical protein WAP57_13040 [Aquabacterium commune]|uniref:hypothetical protein n=1 Tax=Aquabacterium commune TaxID=70586 RepID=UPI003BAF648B